jgi:23S rRNA pseudouridine2605 synthase
MTGLRLQLVLAKAGVASRRAAETLITSGRVAVNGRVARELGVRVDPISDRITVDGREVVREPPAYFLLNKPKGYVTTAADPEGRPTVFDLVQQGGVRLFAVGRLDYNTEGALLLSNDGELAHALMHPSRGVEKVYHAKLRYHLSAEQLDRMRRGLVLPPARPLDAAAKPILPTYRQGRPGGKRPPPPVEKQERSAPCEVSVIKETGQHTWIEVVLHEGKNRQIHRMAEAVGSSLLKLMRIEYAGLDIQNLKVGEARALTEKEIATLRRGVGLSPSLSEPPEPPPRVVSEPKTPLEKKPTRAPEPRRAAEPRRSGPRSGPGDGPRSGAENRPRSGPGNKPRGGPGDRPRSGPGDRPRSGPGNGPRGGPDFRTRSPTPIGT